MAAHRAGTALSRAPAQPGLPASNRCARDPSCPPPSRCAAQDVLEPASPGGLAATRGERGLPQRRFDDLRRCAERIDGRRPCSQRPLFGCPVSWRRPAHKPLAVRGQSGWLLARFSSRPRNAHIRADLDSPPSVQALAAEPLPAEPGWARVSTGGLCCDLGCAVAGPSPQRCAWVHRSVPRRR
jgi:hypothetical protein